MKLEVGQFARLKSGYICKIININDFREPNMKYGVEANYLKDVMFIGDDDIVKVSYNIIDILEVGDVIIDKEGHKYPINYEFETDYNDEYKSYEITIDDHITLFLKDGLSIVPHEQMEQMAYKVEE